MLGAKKAAGRERIEQNTNTAKLLYLQFDPQSFSFHLVLSVYLSVSWLLSCLSGRSFICQLIRLLFSFGGSVRQTAYTPACVFV